MNNFAIRASIIGLTSFSAIYYSQLLDKVSEDDWLAMPDGKLYHKSCIHIHDDEFTLERVDGGSQINGEYFEACPFEPRT